ncbi:hypothetical protein HanIR_Chr10g0452641 [Helianthus annuus]|nr:hypothetical protein HanIR_Chr10g0452641 [Helianthus annuus]
MLGGSHRRALESCGGTTKAGEGSTPAGTTGVLIGSQLEVRVGFLVHQMVLGPRGNSHGLLLLFLAQKK